jgi:hypothetical protein
MKKGVRSYTEQQRDDCPSEIDLDLFVWGDCSNRKANNIRRHLAACSACTKRLSLRRQGFGVFEGVDETNMLTRLMKSIEGEEIQAKVLHRLKQLRLQSQEHSHPAPNRSTWFAPSWIFASALLVLIAVGLMCYLLSSREVIDPIDTVVIKGSLKLVVFREQNGRIEETFSGGNFQAGDRLRFVVDIPFDGYVLLLGIEQSGEKYLFYPAPPIQQSQKISRGKNQLLAGASRLDDSLGEEWIYLLLCSQPISLSDIKLDSEKKGLVVDPNCISTSYKVLKVAL